MSRVAIIGGSRTPFVKAGGAFIKKSFLDLGVHVVKSVVDKYKIDAGQLDEVIFGTVLLDPRTPNAARELVLRSGLPKTLSAHFISVYKGKKQLEAVKCDGVEYYQVNVQVNVRAQQRQYSTYASDNNSYSGMQILCHP